MAKQKIFRIIERTKDNNKASTIFDYFIIVLICLNALAIIIASYNNLQLKYEKILTTFEYFSIAIFTIEYILRIWTAPLKYPNSKIPYLRFIISLMALVDLFAILSFYLPFIIGIDLRFIRMLRLFRLLKLTRYNDATEMIIRVLKKEKDKLLMTLFCTGLMILLASSMLFYIENPIQPDKFPNIIDTFWWCVACLTTADYGDVACITMFGKILSAVIAILGLGLVALPAGILCSGLLDETKKDTCPHCGGNITK